ncbi:hypothetical protein AAEX28_03805 [Lentisphaerota bacterium WC36G]|nr:hypothetical protein LJT99_06680 [Lentisphaerae bacterium WC36]
MMSIKNFCFTVAICFTFCSLFSSCKNLQELEKLINETDDVGMSEEMIKERENKKPGFMISLNEIVKERTTEDIEIMIPSYIYRNQTICVNRNAFLAARNIQKIERVPNKKLPKTYDLILYLDQAGMIKYEVLLTTFKGQKIGILVDRRFYRASKIESPLSEKERKILIHGPFGENVSQKIVEKSTINYKFYNDKSFQKIFNLDKIIDPR